MTTLEVGKTYTDNVDRPKNGNLFVVLAVLYTKQGNWVISQHPSTIEGGRQMPICADLASAETGWTLYTKK